MFDFLRNLFFKKKSVTPDSSPAWRSIGTGYRSSDSLSDIIPSYGTSDLYALHRFHSLATSCISYVSNNVAQARLTATIDDEEVTPPQMTTLMSSGYTISDIIPLLTSSYIITGDAYAIKLRAKNGKFAGLAYVPATSMEPVTSGIVYPVFSKYKYTTGYGQTKEIPSRDVLHMRMIDPSDPTASYSLLRACVRELAMDETRQKYWMEFLNYCPIPGISITTDRPVMPDTRSRVISDIESAAGFGRAGGVVFLPDGLHLEATGAIAEKLDWQAFILNLEARTCAIIGVPPQLLGLESGLKYSTYSNYSEAKKAFYQNTMCPLWVRLGAVMTQSLAVDEGDAGLVFRFDTSRIQELNDHTDEVQLVQSGILTVDEARQRLGYAPIGGVS